MSVPCFEVWVLCHREEFTKKPISARGGNSICDIVKDMVAEKIPDFPNQGESLFKLTSESLQSAIDKAKMFESQHEEVGESYGNPSTENYRLLEDLMKMKRS